jgi:hypothetical protein
VGNDFKSQQISEDRLKGMKFRIKLTFPMLYSTACVEIRKAIRTQYLNLMELQRRHENDPPFAAQVEGAREFYTSLQAPANWISALTPKPKNFTPFVQCPAERVFEIKLVGPKMFTHDEAGAPGLAAKNAASECICPSHQSLRHVHPLDIIDLDSEDAGEITCAATNAALNTGDSPGNCFHFFAHR